MSDHSTPRTAASVAYVLKGFPVLSETFISSEIHRVERAGIPLRIFVVKPRDEREHHPVIDRIRARPVYLPPTSRISDTSRSWWLVTNVPRFIPSFIRVIRRWPGGVLKAAGFALAESVLARTTRWSWPKISYIRDFLVALGLADRLRESGDVRHLHAHFAHDTTTITWLSSMITGLPFSFTAHAKDIYAERLNPRGLLPRKLHAASFVITCTDANQQHLKHLANGTPVHRVYHGLNDDFSRFAASAVPDSPKNGSLNLIAVGRLVAKKGFDVFVDACGILASRDVPFDATIVGDDDDVGDNLKVGNELKRQISRLGIEGQVRMVGQVGQNELHALYLKASALCLPCRVLSNGDRDGIPNVLLEAMSCGVPVVTTPVSGIPELVDDEVNGLFVGQDDPEALADALMRLHSDRELAARLGRAGRITIRERFDGDKLASQIATLFGPVIS